MRFFTFVSYFPYKVSVNPPPFFFIAVISCKRLWDKLLLFIKSKSTFPLYLFCSLESEYYALYFTFIRVPNYYFVLIDVMFYVQNWPLTYIPFYLSTEYVFDYLFIYRDFYTSIYIYISFLKFIFYIYGFCLIVHWICIMVAYKLCKFNQTILHISHIHVECHSSV